MQAPEIRTSPETPQKQGSSELTALGVAAVRVAVAVALNAAIERSSVSELTSVAGSA